MPLDQRITYLGCHAAQVGPPEEPLQFFPTGKKKWKLIQGLRYLKGPTQVPLFIRPHPLALALPNPKQQKELASINSRFGCIVHTESYSFRKQALDRLEREMKGPPLSPELDSGNWSPYKIKKGYRALRIR